MGSVEPDAERMQAFANQLESQGPIVMVNLLRYRERAAYPEGAAATACSGREAYQRYSEVALRTVAEVGGQLVYLGRVAASVIAPAGEEWDDVALVRYPSRRAFVEMIGRADYQAAAVHRSAALADSRLICTEALFPS
jgi:uncharacterized protein (DUF1330 family)